jgi:hypothetical protein
MALLHRLDQQPVCYADRTGDYQQTNNNLLSIQHSSSSAGTQSIYYSTAANYTVTNNVSSIVLINPSFLPKHTLHAKHATQHSEYYHDIFTNPKQPPTTTTNMSSYLPTLLRREDYEASWSPLTLDLLIVLVSLSFAGLVSVGLIYAVRKYQAHRSARHASLPSYHARNIHDLNIRAPPYSRNSAIQNYYDEKTGSPLSPATSPVPEIRITFPDDVDGEGRQLKGRVVVVRVGEKGGVGLEPVKDEEQLPKYERDGKKWDELDMNLMGGLKEKKEFL